MKKKYNVVLSNNEYEIVKVYLRNMNIVYESSQYSTKEIYLSLKLDNEEYEKLAKFIENVVYLENNI